FNGHLYRHLDNCNVMFQPDYNTIILVLSSVLFPNNSEEFRDRWQLPLFSDNLLCPKARLLPDWIKTRSPPVRMEFPTSSICKLPHCDGLVSWCSEGIGSFPPEYFEPGSHWLPMSDNKKFVLPTSGKME